jgi:hypothetical protein
MWMIAVKVAWAPWRQPRKITRLAAITFGTAAAVVMMGMLVSAPAATHVGVPRWAERSIPSDARLVGIINVDRLVQSGLCQSIGAEIGKHESWRALGVRLNPSEIAELVVFAIEYQRPLFLLRTYRDCELEQVAKVGKGCQLAVYNDVEYVPTGSLWVAKIAPRRFCVALSQADVEWEIEHRQRREMVVLREQLSEFFDKAPRADLHLVAIQPPGALKSSIEGFRLSLSFSTDVECQLDLLCRSETEAGNQRRQIQGALKDVGTQLAVLPPAIGRAIADLASAIKVNDDGPMLRITAQWSGDDLKNLVERIQSVPDLPAMLGPLPGLSPPSDLKPAKQSQPEDGPATTPADAVAPALPADNN